MIVLPTPRRVCLALFLLLCAAAPVVAAPLPEFDASFAAAPLAPHARAARTAAEDAALRRLVRVESLDQRFGVPAFVWANRQPAQAAGGATVGGPMARPALSPDQAARAHLGSIAPLYRLDRDDLAGLRLRDLHDTGRGAVIARYQQVVDGIEVFRDEIKVSMSRDLELVSVSGHVPSRLRASAPRAQAFRLEAGQAVSLALQDFAGLDVAPAVTPATLTRIDGYRGFDVPAVMRVRDDGLAVGGGLRAKAVWFQLPAGLEPGYYVEVIGETAACAYVISADDGRLLFRHSIMEDAAFGYRVWANTASPFLPKDGPQGEAPSPHPTGTPNFYNPALIAPSLVTLQNGPISTADPWLAPGATVSTGNNVDAYADLVAPDGFSAGDVRASVTSPGTFDHVYDTNLAPGANATQRMAAVTSLFYVNNFLHDWFYDSGFNEASGNAQTDNYGRGGIGGDPVVAQGQDYGGTNNANMSTPADGGSPRMQMYVFNVSSSNLQVLTPGAVAGTYAVGVATGFGPQTFTLTGTVVAATDATAPVNDVCTAVDNPGTVAGKIALIDRGICSFSTKVQNAQTAGATGVIIVDNVSNPNPPALGGSVGGITIPVVSVTKAVGDAIRAQLGAGVTATLSRQAQLQRDGTIDNHIVAHEWGHYISNRLVGNAGGLTNGQGGGMGEGWGDFHALLLTARSGDPLAPGGAGFAGVYNVGPYALSASAIANNAYYFGIRRYPYTTDMTKNPLTFRHIQDGQALPAGPPLNTNGDPTGASNSEVHRTGEVWCSMLWECYAALLNDTGRLSFDQASLRMRDYLVAGYKLTPNAPTFVEARDAILAAAAAGDPADFQLMAQAFAKRGLGTGAIAPDRNASGNPGVVESFVVGGDLAVTALGLDDDLYSCDNDGYLDNGESATLLVQVVNTGATTLSGTSVTVTSPDGTVSFPSGNVVPVSASAPFQSMVVPVRVDLSGAAPDAVIRLDVAANDPALLVPGPRTTSLYDYVQADEIASSSDAVETKGSTWTTGAGPGAAGGPWRRTQVTPTDHEFFVEDVSTTTDLRLISPPITASPSTPLALTFQHRYSFEGDATNAFDGGVIEISTDGGGTWSDVGGSVAPGYTGTLYVGSGNPIEGRPAWVRTSAGYPAMVATTLNLGLAYAGQTVRLRFRFAADVGVGGPGWWIDDLALSGHVGAPFIALGPETGVCTPVAVADDLPRAVALSVEGGNPSRGQARVRFALPTTDRVAITVHDLAGRRIATLADGEFSPGWHGAAFTRTETGAAPGAGVYFVRLRTGHEQRVMRLVLLR